MLILGQREGEVIYVGKDIQVKLIKLDPTVAQIGIEAPPEILILREEIADL